MNEYASRGVGNEDLGGRKQKEALVGSVVGLRTPGFLRSLFTSLIEVPLVRVPQREELRETGRVDTEVLD